MATSCAANIYAVFLFVITGSVAGGDAGHLPFLVLGDWGGLPVTPFHTMVETAIADRMGKVAETYGTQFQLALGDNFYFDGVKDVDDARFQETFESVFTQKGLQTKWYFVAGNHDHHGNVSAQIDYTAKSNRWTFPDYNYTLHFTVPKTNVTIDVIMIDTILLCGNVKHDFVAAQPLGPRDKILAENQWVWLEQQMKTSKANYLVVAGHFPVISIAEHGPTQCLTQRLLPMLYKYRVTSYFSGHDHNLQHLQYTQSSWTVDYFVIGSANFIDTSTAHKHDVPENSLKFHWADSFSLGGFAYVDVTPQNMTFKFLQANGKELYQKILKPRL